VGECTWTEDPQAVAAECAHLASTLVYNGGWVALHGQNALDESVDNLLEVCEYLLAPLSVLGRLKVVLALELGDERFILCKVIFDGQFGRDGRRQAPLLGGGYILHIRNSGVGMGRRGEHTRREMRLGRYLSSGGRWWFV
jgi:hypothetical protein